MKAALYSKQNRADFAFVSTNSICQGGHVPVLWPLLFGFGLKIAFAYHSFKWRNLASNNAGVTVIIVGLSCEASAVRRLFQVADDDHQSEAKCSVIGPYLIPGSMTIVKGDTTPLFDLSPMDLGNAPYDGGNLIVEFDETASLELSDDQRARWVRPLWGSTEVIDGVSRYCLWISDGDAAEASAVPSIRKRIDATRSMRLASKDAGTRAMAKRPHQFREMHWGRRNTLIVPIRSSETRPFLPVNWFATDARVTNLAYAIYDGPIWNLAIMASRTHLVWIAAVCGKLETRFSYSNKMGWHTFPVPTLTDENKAALTRCAEDILLAREAHFPATIADMYDPEAMDTKYPDLRAAHDRNDETLERIYIGRRFRNDTERLEKLFEMYTEMTAKTIKPSKAGRGRK